MKAGKVKIFFLIFIFAFSNIHAIEITESYIEAYLRGEFNRVFNYYGDISAIGFLELNNVFDFGLGFSLGKSAGSTNIRTHADAAYLPFSRIPLYFSVLYIYNGIPDYENHTHTILPLVSFNTSRAGISLGPNFRFTSFFQEDFIFELIISFSAYVNFINNDKLCIGIGILNFNDFEAKNFGAYTFKFVTAIRLDSSWQIVNELELMQSGGDGLSTVFFGFGWKGGVRYTW